MSTYHSFITSPIFNDDIEERIESKLSEVKEFDGGERSTLQFNKVNFGNAIVFVGFCKNLGGGFHEIALFKDEYVSLTWVSDEGQANTIFGETWDELHEKYSK